MSKSIIDCPIVIADPHRQIQSNTRLPGTFRVLRALQSTVILYTSKLLVMFGPLGISLAPYIRSSKTLSSYIQPIANWYVNVSGYRKYGFKYDDLCKSLGRSYRHGLTFSLEWWKRMTKSKGYDQNSHSFLSKLIEISTGSCTLDSSRMLRSWLPPQARISSKCSAQAVGEGPMDTRRRGMSQNINTSLEMNE